MKKTSYFFAIAMMVVLLASQSCNNQVSNTEESAKIENTLQSVSYFQDTVGVDPTVLLEMFTAINEAIDEIGYPDAGYKIWMNQADATDVRFMVEGLWPDQAAYDLIHDHQLYLDATNDTELDRLVSVDYYRFKMVK